MAVTSYGYPGTIAPGAAWANMQHGLAGQYWVYDVDAVRVTPKTNGTREVNIAAGRFGGWGIHDYNDAVASVQLATVASGTQYSWIFARRTWQTTNATTFVAVAAGASLPTTVPGNGAIRNYNPGTIDDQPLALVSLTAGQTVPVVVADLRWIGVGTGTKTILSDMARSYGSWSGLEFQQGDTRWLRTVNTAGTGTIWLEDAGPFKTKTLPTWINSQAVTHESGWSGNSGLGLVNEVWRDGNTVNLYQLVRRSGATITSNADGNISDVQIGTMAADIRPSRTLSVPARYVGGSSNYPCRVILYASGGVWLSNLHPNIDLPYRSPDTGSGTPWSIEFNATYVQKG